LEYLWIHPAISIETTREAAERELHQFLEENAMSHNLYVNWKTDPNSDDDDQVIAVVATLRSDAEGEGSGCDDGWRALEVEQESAMTEAELQELKAKLKAGPISMPISFTKNGVRMIGIETARKAPTKRSAPNPRRTP
jgi:hypothetical protein